MAAELASAMANAISGGNNFNCPLCETSFLRASHLKRHLGHREHIFATRFWCRSVLKLTFLLTKAKSDINVLAEARILGGESDSRAAAAFLQIKG
jgi:hypothetical protein